MLILHQKSNCHIKLSYGIAQEGSSFVEYLLFHAPFSILNVSEAKDIIDDNVSSRKGVKHLLVHSLHTKWLCNTQSRPNQDELAARITFLDKLGKPHFGYTQCLVDLRKVIEYTYKHNSTNGRFIFSQIKKQSIGSQFQSTQASFNTRPYSLPPVTGLTPNSVTESNQHIYPQSYGNTPKMSSIVTSQKETVTVLNGIANTSNNKNGSYHDLAQI